MAKMRGGEPAGERSPAEGATAQPSTERAPPQKPVGLPPAKTLALPVDLLNEQAVIGAAVVDAVVRKRLVRVLTPEHFFHPDHRAIWRALQECERLQLTWSDEVAARYGCSRSLLLAIVQRGTRENVEWHVRNLQWDRVKNTAALGPLHALVEALRDPKSAPERVRALARHVGDAFDHASTQSFRDPADLVQRTMERVLGDQDAAFLPLGIPGLDFFEDGRIRVLAGSMPGKVTVITALSGSGKSTIASEILLGQRGVRGRGGGQRKVLAGVWEMGPEEALDLMCCQTLEWDRTKLRVQRAGPSGVPLRDSYGERVQLEECKHEITSWVRFWANPFRKKRTHQNRQKQNEENLDVIRQAVADSGCELVLLDLLRFALASTEPSDEDDFLNQMRAMADEEQVHLAVAAQQRIKGDQGVELRADKRPTREGIKGSGGWIEMGDTLIGPHRPALYKTGLADDKIEVGILKQRFGPAPLAVELEWDPVTGRIWGGKSIPYDQPGQQGGEFDDALPVRQRRAR